MYSTADIVFVLELELFWCLGYMKNFRHSKANQDIQSFHNFQPSTKVIFPRVILLFVKQEKTTENKTHI